MRGIDDAAIRQHGEVRFRSNYHYALFEYYRSAKILKRLEWDGVEVVGRVLDAGCGSGGIAVSIAEECGFSVGLDIKNKFSDAGVKLADERRIRNVAFVQADGAALPFASDSFEIVLSHSVIEHVASAEAYLRECHRVLRPGGVLFLQTPPYHSFAGSHLSRLRVPVPIHLLLPRRWAFRLSFYLARKRPGWLKEPRESNTFKLMAERGETKEDDLVQRVTVARVHRWLEAVGFDVVREERHVSGFFAQNLPRFLRRFLETNGVTQNIIISNLELLLRKTQPSP
ncbi:MAG TPA: class I SAM-dependent methyltransferase [Vicinamibacteria bacterium]|nr:class I SAM-dependent methyltransferase [Vicinamibacteria bacterium]